MIPKQRLKEIEEWNDGLKLWSDDHGHNCDVLREYCEGELIGAHEDQIPWLIARIRTLELALKLALKELEFDGHNDQCGLDTIRKIRKALAEE